MSSRRLTTSTTTVWERQSRLLIATSYSTGYCEDKSVEATNSTASDDKQWTNTHTLIHPTLPSLIALMTFGQGTDLVHSIASGICMRDSQNVNRLWQYWKTKVTNWQNRKLNHMPYDVQKNGWKQHDCTINHQQCPIINDKKSVTWIVKTSTVVPMSDHI